jgi:hypothetical protein
MNKKKKKEKKKLLGLIPLISLLVLAASCGSAEDALSLVGEQKKDTTTSKNGVFVTFNGNGGTPLAQQVSLVYSVHPGTGDVLVVDPIVEFTDPNMTMETWLSLHEGSYDFINDPDKLGPKWESNEENSGEGGGGATIPL